MNIFNLAAAGGVVGGIGLLLGALLGYASQFFSVEVNEQERKVREALPGNNCGGCGFSGCDALAEAIVKGEASVSACPVGGESVAKAIADIMGVNADHHEKKTAFVACQGTCDKVNIQYDYYGLEDCQSAGVVPGAGGKACRYGCMGYGSCVKVCEFGAIHVENGVAVVDTDRCVACGKCVAVCPNHLISLIPANAPYVIPCSSQEKGKAVKESCMAGCIGCSLCTRQCEFGAVSMDGNVARMDYDKCQGCGKCALKCPVKVIRVHAAAGISE